MLNDKKLEIDRYVDYGLVYSDKQTVSNLLNKLNKASEIKLPKDKLQELNEFAISIVGNVSLCDEQFLANKILVIQQDIYYTDKPFESAYTRLAKRFSISPRYILFTDIISFSLLSFLDKFIFLKICSFNFL